MSHHADKCFAGKVVILTGLLAHRYDGPLLDEEALVKASESGLSSPEYVNLCMWLASRLTPLCDLEEGISSGPGEIERNTTYVSHFAYPSARLHSGVLRNNSPSD